MAKPGVTALRTVSPTTFICDSYHSQETPGPLTSARSVFISRKIVSVLLAALIPTASALALAACPHGMAERANPQSEMAMMDMAPVQLCITATPTNLCCQMSPAEIAPGGVRASVGGENSDVLITAVRSSASLRATKANTVSDRLSRSSFPSQALLCVFLI